MTGEVERVRPHDLRVGDRIVVAGEVRTVACRPLPQLSDRRQRLVVDTDLGVVSWSIAEAQWPQVERLVATSDRRVA